MPASLLAPSALARSQGRYYDIGNVGGNGHAATLTGDQLAFPDLNVCVGLGMDPRVLCPRWPFSCAAQPGNDFLLGFGTGPLASTSPSTKPRHTNEDKNCRNPTQGAYAQMRAVNRQPWYHRKRGSGWVRTLQNPIANPPKQPFIMLVSPLASANYDGDAESGGKPPAFGEPGYYSYFRNGGYNILCITELS